MATEIVTVQGLGRPLNDPQWNYTLLNYYKDASKAPPDLINSQLTEHELRQARRADDGPNIDKRPVAIVNIAGREEEYSISRHGFCIGHLSSRMSYDRWKDDSELKRVYFPEVTELLKSVTGCKEVFQYEWHVRQGILEEALQVDSKGKVDINGPVRRVHIDESPAAARKEYEYYVPGLLGREDLRNREFGIFNVWKPIKVVKRDPLALCDERTVWDEDLVEGKVQVPNVGEIENFAVRAPVKKEGDGDERRHGFVYVKRQRPEQALVFRIFDARVDGVRKGKRSYGVAHTSFVEEGTEREEARESVEVRSFCVF